MRIPPVGLFAMCAALALPVPAAAQDASQQRASLDLPASPDAALAGQVQPSAPPPPRPVAGPLALGPSGQLASWLQVRGEYRARIEGFSGGGFGNNDDAYWMGRFRFNATVQPTPFLRFVAQAQDARGFDKKTGTQLAPLRDTFDLRLAYGEIGTSTSVRVGRQELAFGEQRLLGHLSWLNTARSFDGARVTVKRPGVQVDAFATSVVTIVPDGFDTSGNGNALYGTYISLSSLLPKQVVEPFFYWRQATGLAAELGGAANLHQATTGLRMAGKLPAAFDYSTEGALQTGSVGPDTVRAFAAHGLLGKTLGDSSRRPRVFAEYNYASGDRNNKDGTRGTFDQLYPTGHDKLGLADQVGWRNISHARAGGEIKPTAAWLLSGSYHSWWLASATDALYAVSGAVVAKSASGAAGRHVGQEVDVQAVYVYSSQLQAGAGYAYVVPGEFLKATTPGRAYSYPFVMVTYVFLGDSPTERRSR